MADLHDDEFYVGYLPKAPRSVAARTRLGVVIIFVAVVSVGLLLINTQSRFDPSVFEFGSVTEHTGVIRETPYPVLEVARPGRTASGSTASTYYLTVFGKKGATVEVEGLDGKTVHLRGTLIYRDDKTMIEIEDGSIQAVDTPVVPQLLETDLGLHTLVGEIVDSMCFLGVMKPGNLTPHRSCAMRLMMEMTYTKK